MSNVDKLLHTPSRIRATANELLYQPVNSNYHKVIVDTAVDMLRAFADKVEKDQLKSISRVSTGLRIVRTPRYKDITRG